MKKDAAFSVLIEEWILDNVGEHPRDLVREVAEHFCVSRQAAHHHVRKLIDEGVLAASGATRGRSYALAVLDEHSFFVAVTRDAAEDLVWRQQLTDRLGMVRENVRDIFHYGFTEILNNALEHSASAVVIVTYRRTARSLQLDIVDHGIGIFRKIQKECKLEDHRHAVLELSKGKLTTDPVRHSGEGIFFTSRLFDHFAIRSSDLYFLRFMDRYGGEDWLLETQPMQDGTWVHMELSTATERTAAAIFNKFAQPEDRTFSRTHIVVDLARYKGETLNSRSQAKRLLMNFEKFKAIDLDFKGIESIGQGFADEVFRVFVQEHPNVAIIPHNVSPEVQWMIDHVRSGGTLYLPGMEPGSSRESASIEGDALSA